MLTRQLVISRPSSTRGGVLVDAYVHAGQLVALREGGHRRVHLGIDAVAVDVGGQEEQLVRDGHHVL